MTQPRPFLKWVGGKTQLLPELIARIPKTWNWEKDLYVEPFVGAGALFWRLGPKRALLNDANLELYNAWLALEECFINELFEWLEELQHDYRENPEGVFDYQRRLIVENLDVPRRAARLIFLNKTCFNGLYRVNKAGMFNTPWGKNPKATVFDKVNLRACADLRASIDLDLKRGDFADLRLPPPGSLIYCDPPYQPVSKTSNFTLYTSGGFDYYDQLRLVTQARYWKDNGCHVMLSQAADEILVEQYRRLGFKCDPIEARRSVNSKGGKRGPVGEYIIY